MKQTVYLIILAISFSLAFTQGKPCCKNKSGKDKVSCKFNQANIDTNKDGIISIEEAKSTEKSGVQCQYSSNINSSDQKKCSGCNTSPWWKFWAKKESCSCKGLNA